MAIFSRKRKAGIPEPTTNAGSTGAAATADAGGELASRTLMRPHVTEKTTGAGSRREYAFVVGRRATKPEIRRAVEALYRVSVTSVNVLNVPGKARRRGRVPGRTPGFRKAIVTLAQGQHIEFTP